MYMTQYIYVYIRKKICSSGFWLNLVNSHRKKMCLWKYLFFWIYEHSFLHLTLFPYLFRKLALYTWWVNGCKYQYDHLSVRSSSYLVNFLFIRKFDTIFNSDLFRHNLTWYFHRSEFCKHVKIIEKILIFPFYSAYWVYRSSVAFDTFIWA